MASKDLEELATLLNRIKSKGEEDVTVAELEMTQATVTQVKVKIGGRQVPHGGVQFPSGIEIDVPISMMTVEDCAREMLQSDIPVLTRIGSSLKQLRTQAQIFELGGVEVRHKIK